MILDQPRDRKTDPDSGAAVIWRPDVRVAPRTKPSPDLCDPREFAPRWWQCPSDGEQ